MTDENSPFLDEWYEEAPGILEARQEVLKWALKDMPDASAVELEPSDFLGVPFRDWSNPGITKTGYVQPHEKTKFDFDAIYGTCCDEIDASNDVSEVVAALDKFIDGHEDKLPLLSTLVRKLRSF